MRLSIAKVAFAAAIPLFFAAPALADEQHDKLIAMCTEGEPDPSSCECQVKALEENVDAKVLQAMIAIQEASKNAKTPEEAEKASADALAAAGMTMEDFEKAMGAAMEKAGAAMEACKTPAPK
jgi:transcriptional regulator GlxA family with amidase domain